MNPYEELDISRNATTEEIRQRYRILAQLHHPDKGGDEEIFKRIKLAYEILSDTIRRKEYDKTGKTHPDRDARNESLDIIGQLLFRIIPNFNPEIDNLIGMMTEDIIKTKQELNVNITTCETYISKINKVIQRLNIKTDDENLILKFLEKQLDTRLQENLEFKRKIEICEIVLSILKDYEYGLASLMPPLDN
jgi:curved DNA-binding protein CbpA